MAEFRFARNRFYSDLDIEVRLSIVRNEAIQYTGRASVKAKGQPGARQRWRDEFWAWAENRNLDAVAPRYGNRRIDGTSVYDCYLKDWQTVADFMVMWVGLEALNHALTSREDIEDRVEKEVQKLTAVVFSMVETLTRIEQASSRQDQAWDRLRSSLIPASDRI